MHLRKWFIGALVIIVLAVVGIIGRSIVKHDGPTEYLTPPVAFSDPGGAGGGVGVHGTIANPADIDGSRAEEIYQAILPNLIREYVQAGDPVAGQYREWKRYNTMPYRSAMHGMHFLNSYANELAVGYGKYEGVGVFPEGAMIVKDSFTVSDQGTILSGPLFLMEKMPAGFASADGDWRYMMIEPSGRITGLSGGIRSANVKFCAACHNKAPASSDHMYFMPKGVRVH